VSIGYWSIVNDMVRLYNFISSFVLFTDGRLQSHPSVAGHGSPEMLLVNQWIRVLLLPPDLHPPVLQLRHVRGHRLQSLEELWGHSVC